MRGVVFALLMAACASQKGRTPTGAAENALNPCVGAASQVVSDAASRFSTQARALLVSEGKDYGLSAQQMAVLGEYLETSRVLDAHESWGTEIPKLMSRVAKFRNATADDFETEVIAAIGDLEDLQSRLIGRAPKVVPKSVAAKVPTSIPFSDLFKLKRVVPNQEYEVVFLRENPLSVGPQTLVFSPDVAKFLNMKLAAGNGIKYLDAIQMGIARAEQQPGFKSPPRDVPSSEVPYDWFLKVMGHGTTQRIGTDRRQNRWMLMEVMVLH